MPTHAVQTRHLLIVFGTRPEAVKMAPVVHAGRRQPERFRVTVVSTGQHREMLDPFIRLFGLAPDRDLRIMSQGQAPGQVMAAVLSTLPALLSELRPDWVLVQGDTSTALAAALASYLERTRVAHVEAGLRTGNKGQPFPEEINRRCIAPIADLHFAPTAKARDHLLAEAVPESQIEVTGNTVVDAVRWMAKRIAEPGAVDERLRAEVDAWMLGRRMVLITGHRRESFGGPLRAVCEALATLAREHPDVVWIYPVHLNPNVQGPVRELLGSIPNVHLMSPVGYPEFLYLLSRCRFALTDSGGVQEEAPSLGKPTLVMRNTTERPEGIDAGCAELVGTDPATIVRTASRLLNDPAAYRRMVAAENPYGSGDAAERILARLAREE
jgi:UDP-N-acetylglucosamine 2-epimerase (non-hydrolysing)